MNFLRLILTLIVLIYFGFVIIAWGFAVGGDPILILDAFDMDAEMALEPWQLAIGLLMSIFFLATLAIIWQQVERCPSIAYLVEIALKESCWHLRVMQQHKQ